jgi:hypothetical protein
MSRFLLPLERYQVMVRGSGIHLEHPGERPSIGFYTTRWVGAFSSERAVKKAIDEVRAAWSRRQYAKDSPNPKLEVEEIEVVDFWKARFWKTQGFVLFGDQE